MVGKQWHAYWASGGSGESALSNPAQRNFLAQHWLGLFAAHASPGSIVVDVGCGDGAIFGFARDVLQQKAPGATLIALDASDAAARCAMKMARGVNGVASDACRIPLREGAADLVVSQFGMEYAGAKAFEEAARVLKPGGAMSAMCHMKQGSISAECAENLRVLNLFFKEQVAEHARESLANSYASRYAPTTGPNRAEKKFQQALRRVGGAVDGSPNSVAKVSVSSALSEIAAMAAKRQAYDSAEALGFIDQVKRTLASYRERMRSMIAAALDQPGVEKICAVLSDAGLTDVSAEQVAFSPGAPISAWRMQARRA